MFKQTTIAISIVLSMLVIGSPALAQEDQDLTEEQQAQLQQEEQRQEAFVQRQRRTDNIDIGFRIPTPEEVEAARNARRNQTASERIGRIIMRAFEEYEDDDLNSAISRLEGAEPRTDYDRAYVQRFLGNMYAFADREEDALRLMTQAADLDVLGFNDQAAALLLVANLNLQAENYEQALRYYQEWLEFTGEMDPDVFIRMSNSYLQLEQYERVVPFARKSLHYQLEPDRNPFVLQVAALFELGRVGSAIEVLEEGIQLIPNERRWWSQLGMMYFQQERGEEALATMELAHLAGFLESENDLRALAQMYSNRLIPYRAGVLLRDSMDSGDIEETSRNYATAASTFHSAREFGLANDMYVKAAELADNNEARFDYHRRRGNALLLASDYAEAARAFSAATELADSADGNLGRVYMSLAEAYFYEERYREAVRAAERAAGFSDQRRNAESWAQYIRSTAERRGADI